MKEIQGYTIEGLGAPTRLDMPIGAIILGVIYERATGQLRIFANVPQRPQGQREREFQALRTRHPLPTGFVYIGSLIMPDGPNGEFVFHVGELV